MADATKAQKLAAARKKLKEYQQKSHKPSKTALENEENLAVSETMSNSTHSSINGNFDSVPSEPVNNSQPAHVSPFHNYFNGNQQSVFYQEPTNFFDNLANLNQISTDDTSSVNSMTITNANYIDDTKGVQLYNNYESGNQVLSPSVISDDVRSLDDPEIKPNDIYGYFNKTENAEHPTISSEDAKKLSEYMSSDYVTVDDTIHNKLQKDNLDSQDSTDHNVVQQNVQETAYNQHDSPVLFSKSLNSNTESLQQLSSQITELKSDDVTSNLPHTSELKRRDQESAALLEQEQLESQKVLNSNTESLRQLSSQITELISDDVTSNLSHTSELERRNQELAALLEQERLESQKVRAQLKEYQNRTAQLEAVCQQIKIDNEHRLNREVGPLQEQLQCHAQTVGILVGEKTELSTALSQSQLLAKQKVTECEELQGRLKTSRSRVADLEKEIQNLKSAKLKFEQNNLEEEEIAKLKKEHQELKVQREEVTQDLLELREKLNIKANENLALQREIQEITHQFSLAQVKIEQITAGENLQAESQVETLTQQKLALEKQVLELSQALKATGEERDQASVQYQHYVQQLNGQVAALANKLENMTVENESLAKREQNLVQHISELEKHLQNIQDDRINFVTNRGGLETKKELESALESVQNLQAQKSKLEENYQSVVGERDDLLREIASKKELIEQLESELERLQVEQPDSTKLLAAMESDKVAAARAVTQNSELKQQLEEMQQAFVRMSNDKLDLTEKLTSEEYRNKELSDKLHNIEHQLHTLTDAITIKDNELTQMRETLVHKNKQILQHDQLADRLRHYEAQDGSSHSLQVELQKAQEFIQQLTKENLKWKQDVENLSKPNNSEIENFQKALKLEHEENEQQIKENDYTSITNAEAGSQTIENEIQNTSESNVDLNTLNKEVAMKHLEEKFTRTMQDIANLTEEKHRLEHLVTQLQGETETIGEYIALYQHQRGILKQRTQEKDEQLKRLAQDREKVRSKLDLLNGLVKKLVIEKGVLTPEILEQHTQLNSQSHELCTEHAKIQQEINKIAQQNIPSTEASQESQVNENNNLSTETAEEIIALLAEIKSSNLIQPSEGLENFHPCPWCSGQLLTV